MSKVLQFPRKIIKEPLLDCGHGNTTAGMGYQQLGTLRYEYPTNTCLDCGAFSTNNEQFDAFKKWLLKQPSKCFQVPGIVLRAPSVKLASDLASSFKKTKPEVFRACLALYVSAAIPDEEWEWKKVEPKAFHFVRPIYLHPLLYLQFESCARLASLPIAEAASKVIGTCLRQYNDSKNKFRLLLESFLVC